MKAIRYFCKNIHLRCSIGCIEIDVLNKFYSKISEILQFLQ